MTDNPYPKDWKELATFYTYIEMEKGKSLVLMIYNNKF